MTDDTAAWFNQFYTYTLPDIHASNVKSLKANNKFCPKVAFLAPYSNSTFIFKTNYKKIVFWVLVVQDSVLVPSG